MNNVVEFAEHRAMANIGTVVKLAEAVFENDRVSQCEACREKRMRELIGHLERAELAPVFALASAMRGEPGNRFCTVDYRIGTTKEGIIS